MATRKKSAAPRASKSGKSTKAGKSAPTKRRRGKLAPNAKARGLEAAEVAIAMDSPEVAALATLVREAGGAPIGAYHEPLGGRALMLASIPLNAVQPTPFQRDLSPTHAKRLAEKIDETAAFLDPLIVVRGDDGRLWTPNGRHRLAAAKVLGLRQITALISPDETLAYRILALNTEKAHNLKERSLEVIRMLRGLIETRKGTELDVAPLLEEPAFATLGAAYEKRPRLSGGAYHSIVKRIDGFLDEPLPEALGIREERADVLLKLDDAVSGAVDRLKSRGMTSPYLRPFVVARINYLRFVKPKPGAPPLEFDATLEKLTRAAEKFNAEKVKESDIKAAGGTMEAEPE
jgi:ParB family chromosome partitioning protein